MKYTFIILLITIVFSGCAMMDRALTPVDNNINKSETIYNDIKYDVDKSINNINQNIKGLASDLHESSIVKFFSDEKTILKYRDENFVKWSEKSRYNSKQLIVKYLNKNDIKLNERDLKVSDKMDILNKFFFNKLKNEYARKFQQKNKKVTFDSFLTDRENINKIHNYKTKLKHWEHEWNINMYETHKKVAKLMLSTLFHTPRIKFISYNPYDEKLYLNVFSRKNKFNQKIYVKVDRDLAKNIEKNINYLKPIIYFKFKENKLDLAAVNLIYKKKKLFAEFTDETYFRNSSIVFSTDKLSLKDQDVSYSEIVKNIVPPSWYYNLEDKNIEYGQGKDKNDAKNDAYKNIAQNIKVVVNSNFTMTKKISGSLSTKHLKSDTNVKADDISIENSKVIKVEKKDGIWFVAIEY